MKKLPHEKRAWEKSEYYLERFDSRDWKAHLKKTIPEFEKGERT